MIVKIHFDFSDEDRAALSNHYGDKGLATRETVRKFIESTIIYTLVVLRQEKEEDEKEEQGRGK